MSLTQILLCTFCCNSIFILPWFVIKLWWFYSEQQKENIQRIWNNYIIFAQKYYNSTSDRVKLTKCENWQSAKLTKFNRVKNAIMQATYFLNGTMFGLLFSCHVISYWEKVTSYEKFIQNLSLEAQIVWKSSVF